MFPMKTDITHGMALAGAKDWLSAYASNFRLGDGPTVPMAAVLVEHSRQVSEEMLNLGGQLGLEDSMCELAGVIGLFHDVGRFGQGPGQGFFDVDAGREAGERGVAVLEQEGVPGQLSAPDLDVVRQCILAHHECLRTSRRETATVTLLTDILHDADRLDNWRIALREYRQVNGCRNPVVRHGLSDSPGCSLRVRNQVTAGRPVDARDVRNLNDLRLLQLGWIFDVRLQPTLERVRTRETLDALRRSLHGCGGLDALFAPAQARAQGG